MKPRSPHFLVLALLGALTLGCTGSKSVHNDDREISELLEQCRVDSLDRIHGRLTLEGQLSLVEHENLLPDVELLGRLCGDDFSVSIKCTGDVLRAHDSFRPFLVEEKLGDALDPGPVPEYAKLADGGLAALVQFHPDADDQAAEEVLEAVGSTNVVHYGPNTWHVEIPASNLRTLAKQDLVKRIEAGPPPFSALVETARASSHVDCVHHLRLQGGKPIYDLGGKGAKIGICDNGIDSAHDDFAGTTPRVDPDDTNVGKGHGTMVASVAAGDGSASEKSGLSPFERRGQAPEARLAEYVGFGFVVKDFDRWYRAYVEDGVHVMNHSHVESRGGRYGILAANLDAIVRGDAIVKKGRIPSRPQVWAAGNCGNAVRVGCSGEGYESVLTAAKNTISVGSISSGTRRLSQFSSMGPLSDGRTKPDLVAPGAREFTGIQAAKAKSQFEYTQKSGTSLAAPVVSGTIALMVQAFERAYGKPPSIRAATFKAILVDGTTDLVKRQPYANYDFPNPDTGKPTVYFEGPDHSTGFGQLDAAVSVATIQEGRWIEASIASKDDTDVYCLQVGLNSRALSVTLAWDDEPGDTLAAQTCPKLVNDLDLLLLDGVGNDVHPMSMPPDVSIKTVMKAADRYPDELNNVERVRIAVPDHGIWTVLVRGYNRLGKTQPYSLAFSHKLVPCPDHTKDLCDKTNEECPAQDVCADLPFVCQSDTRIFDGRIDTDRRPRSGDVMALDQLCASVLECPECTGRPWEDCPDWVVTLSGLPEDAEVIVFDDEGNVVVDDSGRGSTRLLTISKRRAGRRYFATFLSAGSPEIPFNVGVEID